MEEGSSPGTRSPKRPRATSSSPNDAKRVKVSPSEALRDDTLRILTQSLRDENKQLLQDKEALNARLEQAQRSLRDLEDDVALVCRQKTEMEQKLRQKPAGPDDTNSTVLHTQTAIEMDRFLQSCELWQLKLKDLSQELAQKTQNVENQELQSVVRDLVTSVETKSMEIELQSQQQLLEEANWLQKETTECLRELQETEIFGALEKQLTDDRVVELETQLAQKRTVEKEKEMELSSLRAGQEDSICEKKSMEEELKKMKEENDVLKEKNQKLMEDKQQLQEGKEKSDKKIMTQEEEIKKLQKQLQALKTVEMKVKAAERELHKSQQRKEELRILYAKFSSSMDSISEKTMRLEELEQEVKDAQKTIRDVQAQNKELEEQVALLKEDTSAQNRCNADLSERLGTMQKQYEELRALELKQKDLVTELQAEVAELKEKLKERRVKQEQSASQSSHEDSENTLIVQVAEKEALQMFVKKYYAAAEEKCGKLLEKVRELEAQKENTQEQTKESCSVLRRCTQVNKCDESLRASLMDVMTTLESLP